MLFSDSPCWEIPTVAYLTKSLRMRATACYRMKAGDLSPFLSKGLTLKMDDSFELSMHENQFPQNIYDDFSPSCPPRMLHTARYGMSAGAKWRNLGTSSGHNFVSREASRWRPIERYQTSQRTLKFVVT